MRSGCFALKPDTANGSHSRPTMSASSDPTRRFRRSPTRARTRRHHEIAVHGVDRAAISCSSSRTYASSKNSFASGSSAQTPGSARASSSLKERCAWRAPGRTPAATACTGGPRSPEPGDGVEPVEIHRHLARELGRVASGTRGTEVDALDEHRGVRAVGLADLEKIGQSARRDGEGSCRTRVLPEAELLDRVAQRRQRKPTPCIAVPGVTLEDGAEQSPGGRHVAQLQTRISEPDRGVRVSRPELELFLERRGGLREGPASVAAPSGSASAQGSLTGDGSVAGTIRARDERSRSAQSHPFPVPSRVRSNPFIGRLPLGPARKAVR